MFDPSNITGDNKPNIYILDGESLNVLIEEIVKRTGLSQKQRDKWIDGKECMEMLHITSKSTLQKHRNEGDFEYSKINAQTILYNRFSVEEFIESKKHKTF